MRLKKITQELKTALGTEPGKKKRAKKITKLVDELGKKKKRLEAKAKTVEGAKKKIDHKIEVCEAELSRGKKALRPGAAKPAAASESDTKPRQEDKPNAKDSGEQRKPERATRSVPH